MVIKDQRKLYKHELQTILFKVYFLFITVLKAMFSQTSHDID